MGRLQPGGGRRLLWPWALLALAALLRLPTLGHPLTEVHAFRQTQTAFPAVVYAQQGIDLLHPQVPVFGEPWVLPFEFPLYQAAASLLIRAGLSPEVALRGLSLLAFLAAAWLLWAILERHVGRRPAQVALAVFSLSPFALLWSRTSMVEYPAVAASLAFMLGVLEWQAGRGHRWLLLALVGGGLAALLKLTTAVFWLAPAVATRRLPIIGIIGLSAAAGVTWSRYAEAERLLTAAGSLLTGGELYRWVFGGDRLDPAMWIQVAGGLVLTGGMFLLPVAGLVVVRPERLVWAWFGVALLAPPLVFANLYAWHDYYAVAITPALAGLIGGGADVLLNRRPTYRWLLAAGAVASLAVSWPYWRVAYTGADPDGVAHAAAIISAAPEPVALRCSDWSPAAFFYAGRRGFISWRGLEIPDGYRLLVSPLACPDTSRELD